MVTPLKGGILSRKYNNSLHGRSVYRPKDVYHHNVILGYSKPGIGDAVDIFLPAGTEVYAMHDGRINRIADRGGRLSCIYIAGKGITTVYAHLHIRERITLGMQVHEGELIGWIGRILTNPHLHLEVWKDGKSISAKSGTALAVKISKLFEV